MNKQEKKLFVKLMLKTIQNNILGKISKMPDNWDEVELNWLIVDETKNFNFSSTMIYIIVCS